MKRLWQKWFGRSVYVVVANDCEKVKECIVVTDPDEATRLYGRLRSIYGGASVCMASRHINNVPVIHLATQPTEEAP